MVLRAGLSTTISLPQARLYLSSLPTFILLLAFLCPAAAFPLPNQIEAEVGYSGPKCHPPDYTTQQPHGTVHEIYYANCIRIVNHFFDKWPVRRGGEKVRLDDRIAYRWVRFRDNWPNSVAAFHQERYVTPTGEGAMAALIDLDSGHLATGVTATPERIKQLMRGICHQCVFSQRLGRKFGGINIEEGFKIDFQGYADLAATDRLPENKTNAGV
ncbi:MAG: hypothetical protein LQ342_004784 [Letrouitia transgressa]|nr:MAG: hypothetical protein LQ342_004784 [Letrouitia transgressa]